jgi:hypothetical protein
MKRRVSMKGFLRLTLKTMEDMILHQLLLSLLSNSYPTDAWFSYKDWQKYSEW